MNAIELTLGTNNSALKTGLDQAKGQVENFKSQAHHMLMGLFAGVGIEQLIEKFSHVQDMAETFGTTAEAVQRVDQYAQQFGTSIDGVSKALAKLRSDGGDKLGKLGIDAKEFAGAEMDQQLVMIAEALGKIPDEQERVNMAFEVLGPRVKEIMPMLLAGGDAMRGFFGGASVASNETVAAIDAAGDKLTELKNKVMVFAADIFGFIDKVMLSIGNGVGSAISLVGNGIGRLGEGLSALLQGDFSGVKASMEANVSDLKSGLSGSMESLREIWSGKPDAKKPGNKLSGLAATDEESSSAGKARQSLEERIASLRHDHDLKAMEAGERLKQLSEERLQLEKQLASLGKDKTDERKQVEDKILANERERISAEDEKKRAEEKAGQEQLDQLNKEAAEYEKNLKKQEEARRKAADKEKAEVAKKEKQAEQKTREEFQQREKDLGFASGIKQVGESGQRLAGVNYDVINAEAEKGIKIQEEMRNFLKVISEKEYKVELPDAS